VKEEQSALNGRETQKQKKLTNLPSSLASMASFRSGEKQSALNGREMGN